MKFSSGTLTINPVEDKEIAVYLITVALTDDYLFKEYQFNVNVTEDISANRTLKNIGFQASNAEVSLFQVTRDGILKMKIMSPILSFDLIKSIKKVDF